MLRRVVLVHAVSLLTATLLALPAGTAAAGTSASFPQTPPLTEPDTPTVPFRAPGPPKPGEPPSPPPAEHWTPRSHVVRNDDGSYTAELYAGTQFRRSGGVWTAVDSTVRPNSDPDYPFAVPDVVVPVRLGDRATGLVQWTTPQGPLTLTATGLDVRRPVRATEPQNRVVYPGVESAADLRVDVDATTVSLTQVLRGPAAPTRYTYHLSDPDGILGEVREDGEGGYEFTNEVDGHTVAIGAPNAYELSPATDGIEAVTFNAGSAHLEVVPAGDGFDVVEWVDDEWLVGKQFPIALDPTVSFNYATAGATDCHIVSGSHAADRYCTSTSAEVGFSTSSGWIRRYLLQFPMDAIPLNSQITSGSLKLYVNAILGTQVAVPNEVRLVTYNQEWTNPSWTYKTGTTAWGAGTGGSPATTIYDARNIGTTPGFVTFNQSGMTTAVQSLWSLDPRGQNRGFLLKTNAANEAASASVIRYATHEDTTTSRRPVLTVVYNPPPAAPVITQTSAGDASVTVDFADGPPNGGAAATSYNVTLYTSTGVAFTPQSIAAGQPMRATFTGLENLSAYYAKVSAINGIGESPQSAAGLTVTPHRSPEVTLRIDPTTLQPALLQAPTNGVYARGQRMQFAFTVKNRDVATAPITARVPLPTGIVSNAGTIRVGGNACGGAITCSVSTPTATTPATIQVTGLSLAPNATAEITADVAVVDRERGCVAVTVPGSAVTATNMTDGSTSVSTGNALADLTFTLCDAGLGLEPWWQFTAVNTGRGGVVSANAGNGNVVVQQQDTPPVQGHGDLAHFTSRTYNSQESTLIALPGAIAKGWTLNAGSIGVAGLSPGGLVLNDAVTSLLNPLAVTLVDRDGTRHVFTPRATPANLDPAALTGIAAALQPRTLTGTNERFCVDVSYTAPPGVHLGLFRYLAVPTASSCASAGTATGARIAGYVAIRPDRLRTEFDTAGRPTTLIDGAGNQLDYAYDTAGRLTSITEKQRSGATGVARKTTLAYAGRSNPLPADGCGNAASRVDVTDPAGRVTRYCTSTDPLTNVPGHLLRVVDPDGSAVDYAYQGVVGAGGGAAGACVGALTGMLCSVSNKQSASASTRYTSITYATAAAPVPDLPRVASITDRRGKVVTVDYHYDADTPYVDYNRYGHRTRYEGIDGAGRVSSIIEGTPDTTTPSTIQAVRRTDFTWDTAGATCRIPDNVVDNNLCSSTRRTLGVTGDYEDKGLTAPPDTRTDALYNVEGAVVRQRAHTNNGAVGDNIDTTYGYRSQEVDPLGGVTCFTDVPAGGGNVATGNTVCTGHTVQGSGSRGSGLFAVTSQISELTPNGNTAGGGYGTYLTTHTVDDNALADPNAVTTSACTTPTAPTGNTGALCRTVEPGVSSTPNRITSYAYDGFGQRTSMTNARGNTTRYVYFADGPNAFLGTDGTSIQQGGWLRAVVDATQQAEPDPAAVDEGYVAFAYDAAGNAVRTWDRNATAATTGTLADFPGTRTGPPSLAYTETLHKALPGKTSFTGPDRPLASESRAVVTSGARTEDKQTYTTDWNGNVLEIVPPRGNVSGADPADFRLTRTYNENDQVLTEQQPLAATTTELSGTSLVAVDDQPATQYLYDDHGNRIAERSPEGHVREHVFDAANREIRSVAARGAGTDTALVASSTGCSVLTSGQAAAYAWLTAGLLVCPTSTNYYDGQGHVLQTDDPLGFSSFAVLDGAGRVTKQVVERSGSVDLITAYVYTADSQVARICPPRAFAEGGVTTCGSPNYYGTNRSYYYSGDLSAETVYRASGQAVTTNYGYDLNANVTSIVPPGRSNTTLTYDALDRRVCEERPRTTQDYYVVTEYDFSGNLTWKSRLGGTSCTAGETRGTQYTYDTANRLVEVVDVAAGGELAAGGSDVKRRYHYDADGHVDVEYDPRAFANGSTPNEAYATRRVYDELGRVAQELVPRSDSTVTNTSGSTATDAQCPTNAAYPSGVRVCVTNVRYDKNGDVSRVWMPSAAGVTDASDATYGQRRTDYVYTYDRLPYRQDLPRPAGAGSGRTGVRSFYDALGKRTVTWDQADRPTTYTYTGDGLVSNVTYPPSAGGTAHTESTTYDTAGNVLTHTGTDGVVQTNTWTLDNLLLTTTTPNDRPGTVDPAGNVTSYVYDLSGMPTQVFSPSANAAPNATYRDASLTVQRPTFNSYSNDNLLLTSVTPVSANGTSTLRRTTYGYDPAGRKTSATTDFVSFSGTNAAPVFTPTASPDTSTQTFAYFKNDRLKSETGRGGSGTIQYEYDLAGNRTLASATTGTVTARYYLDSLVREVDGAGRRTSYAYDGNGVTSARGVATLTNGTPGTYSTTTYVNDDAGLVSSITAPVAVNANGAPGASTGTTTITRNTRGLVTTQQDPSGAYSTFSYDGGDDMLISLAVRTQASGGTDLSRWDYTYDAGYRLLSQTFSGVDALGAAAETTFDYGYHPQSGRLDQFTIGGGSTQGINYDHDGNRLCYGVSCGYETVIGSGTSKTTFTYQADDSIATETAPNKSPRTYAHRSFGAMSSDGCNTYVHDGFDRLSSVTPAAVNTTLGCPGGTATTYGYDALGRQVSRMHSGTTTDLAYDGLSSHVSREVAGTTTIDYAVAPDGSPIALRSSASTGPQYLVQDGKGSTGSVFTAGSGGVATAVCQNRYDPYGSALSAVGGSTSTCTPARTPNNVWYRSGRRDAATGQYQMGSRTYDPAKAGFLTPDSFRSEQPEKDLSIGTDPLLANRYAYVNGDPVNLVDPSGHAAIEPSGGGPYCDAKCELDQRYRENRQKVVDQLASLKAEYAALVAGAKDPNVQNPPNGAMRLTIIPGQIEGLEKLLADDAAQIYDVDWDAYGGDGKLVVVYGDLINARNVGITVPGMGTDMWKTGWRKDARNLQAGDPDVATIAWLQYDAPGFKQVGIDERAETGAKHLATFIDSLGLKDDRHVTVVGHSYGSLLVGLTLKQRKVTTQLDDVAFVGSPGVSADHATEYADMATRIWAGRAPGDVIVGRLGRYGVQPASDRFGALHMPMSGNQGHSSYFEPGTGSGERLREIVAGMYEGLAWGGRGGSW